MDGDCLVTTDFILTHSRLAESGKFVAGARSYIKRRRSATMVAAGPAGRSIRRFVWFWRALFAQANRRSEEHTSELQSLMRISYAVFCLKKKKKTKKKTTDT